MTETNAIGTGIGGQDYLDRPASSGRCSAVLDLPYEEDSSADVDMNFVITGEEKLVEVQGTAEKEPFSRDVLNELTDLGMSGCKDLRRAQLAALGDVAVMMGLVAP